MGETEREAAEKELLAAQQNLDRVSYRLRNVTDDMIAIEREFGAAVARLERATDACVPKVSEDA